MRMILSSIFITCSCMLISSCQENQKTSRPIEKDLVEVVDDTKIENLPLELIIQDSSAYSQSFIKEFANEETPYQKINLIGDLLIIDNKDTVTFPQYPPLGKKMLFTGRKGDLVVALTVKRINQTTIDYKTEIVEFGKSNSFQEGQADLGSMFFLASEVDENSRTGISYLSTEYTSNKDSCYTNIRIGKEDEKQHLLAKIIKNCNGSLQDINIDNFPTLIEK